MDKNMTTRNLKNFAKAWESRITIQLQDIHKLMDRKKS